MHADPPLTIAVDSDGMSESDSANRRARAITIISALSTIISTLSMIELGSADV